MTNAIKTIATNSPRIKIFAFTRPIAQSGAYESRCFERVEQSPFDYEPRGELEKLRDGLCNAIFAVGGIEKITLRKFEVGVTFASAYNRNSHIAKVRDAIVAFLFGTEAVSVDNNDRVITWFEGAHPIQRIYSVSHAVGSDAVKTFVQGQLSSDSLIRDDNRIAHQIASAILLLSPVRAVKITGCEVSVQLTDAALWKPAHDYIVATIKRVRFEGESVKVRHGLDKPDSAKDRTLV